MIQTAANQNLATPSETRESDLIFTDAPDSSPQDFRLTFQATTSVTTFNFYTGEGLFELCLRASLSTHLNLAWGDPGYACFRPRLQAYITDTELHPDDVVLVEGYFQVNLTTVMHVLARMRYEPEAPDDEHYIVISSMFRTVDK